VARLHDEQGNLVAYYQLPYSFKIVANGNRGRSRDLQDKRLSIVHPPVFSPAVTTMTFESSDVSYRTASRGSSVSAFSQRPAPGSQHHTNIRHSEPPIRYPSQWEDIESGSRKGVQQTEAGDQPLLQKVVPIGGPTRGGLNIILTGTDLPPWPTIVYARFGSAAVVTVSHKVPLQPSHSKSSL
jgi:hypothetical protein